MKKIIIILAVLTITLTACGASSKTTTGSQNGGTLSAMTQLVVGTLKLEGTDQAVTKQQAAELLPLWQVYQQLIASDTAAQAEIDGLAGQIRDAMTSDQSKAIADMKLTQADVVAFMQQQGVSMGPTPSAGGSKSGTSNQGGSGFPGGGDPGGGMPPGGFPGGDPGGGMPGGNTTTRQGSSTQTANATPGAQPGRGGNMNRVPSALIDALIQYLQKTAGS